MLTISARALAFIRSKRRPLHLDLPRMVRGCCFDFQECPSVRLGEPRDPHRYERQVIDDTPVFVPHDLPRDLALEITLNGFLGFRWLVVEGWRYF